MSEITKACEVGYDVCPKCGEHGVWIAIRHGRDEVCPGRVPDVEATLRAEVARLKDVAGAAHGLVLALRKPDIHCIGVAERAVVLALNATGTGDIGDIVRARNTPERIAEIIVENEKLECENDRLTATLAERDGEIARLVGREREAADLIRDAANAPSGLHSAKGWNLARAAWLAGCKS